MSTRAAVIIAKKNEQGVKQYTVWHVHSDGYPQYTGLMLFTHFKIDEQREAFFKIDGLHIDYINPNGQIDYDPYNEIEFKREVFDTSLEAKQYLPKTDVQYAYMWESYKEDCSEGSWWFMPVGFQLLDETDCSWQQ